MESIKSLPGIKHTDKNNFFLIAGPCVIESRELCHETAEKLVSLSEKYSIPYIFKSSYKKANRSRIDSFTGIGDKQGLEILSEIKNKYNIPVLTDVHSAEEAAFAANYVDVIQIPAFLCRQTDILVAAAKTGKVVNVKKGQFLSAASMKFVAKKITDSGNDKVWLTDRGTMFGYGDLIVDYRAIKIMKSLGFPVILDITHSLQQPNQESGVSGGQPEMIETLARASIAVGVDGIFLETHPNPSEAKSDGANMLELKKMDKLLEKLVAIKKVINTIDD